MALKLHALEKEKRKKRKERKQDLMLWRVSITVGGRPPKSRTNNLFQELILVWMWMMDFLGTLGHECFQRCQTGNHLAR